MIVYLIVFFIGLFLGTLLAGLIWNKAVTLYRRMAIESTRSRKALVWENISLRADLRKLQAEGIDNDPADYWKRQG